ncbi:hypothetical protein ABPG75_012015 [Micractinium tetrahymenae]
MSGAALSDYGQRTLEERRRLLGALVQRLTGEQPSTERHRELLETAVLTTQHHRFADIAPRVVDELLDRLGERLGEHAQFGKQRALQLLRSHLLEVPLELSQYEFQHRLLAFLYAASRAPLSAHYAGGPLVDALEEQARNAVVGPPTYLSDASSEGGWVEESGLYGPGSQLSDWSDVEAEEAEAEAMSVDGAGSGVAAPPVRAAGGGAGGAAAAPPGNEADSGAPTALDAAAAARAAAAAQAAGSLAQLFPPSSRQGRLRETPYTRSSLSVWLASKQSGGQPARVLQPALCFHERELVQQVLHMLKGVASPGPAFQLDPVRDAYHPRPGVHLHYSSMGSARALLARFARWATALRRVQAFCAAVARGSRPDGGPLGPESAHDQERQQQEQDVGKHSQRDAPEQRLLALPTVAAFAAAVAEEEQALQQQVLVLEAACTSGVLGSLVQLRQRTASLAEQAELLAALARRCCAWRGTAADSAAGLLSALHEALLQQLLLVRSQGGALASMLLRIFAAACRPLLATVHKWLYRGVLDDPFEEFFVMKAPGPEVPTDSPRFWSEAFILRPASTGSLSAGAAAAVGAGAPAPPAAPSFLAPLAGSILAAGKSSLLLQAYSSWRLAAAAAAPTGAAAVTARQHLASSYGGAAPAEGPPSPAKRRLSEFGALGFAVAADHWPQQQQPGQEQGPYGVGRAHSVPLPTIAAAGAWELLCSSSHGVGDGPSLEPPQLHQKLLEGLEAQLEEKLALAKRLQQQQQLEVQQLQAATAAAGGHADGSSTSSTTGSSRIFTGDWQQPAAACGDHALLLPAQDTLPPLPAVPPTPEGLPVASIAIISPAGAEHSNCDDGADEAAAHDARAAAAAGAVSKQGSSSSGSSGASREPSIAERMRQAAAARASQASGLAAAQLPLLIIPPAPLEACLAAAPDRIDQATGSSAADMQQAGGPASEAAAAQFDSRSWQEWYRQTAAALSQQLHVLDCLGPLVSGTAGGGSGGGRHRTGGRGGRRRQPLAGSFGVPLGLATDSCGSACDQLWGRSSSSTAGRTSSGSDGSGGTSKVLSSSGAARQRREQLRLAAEAPPLDVLLERSLVHPIQAQVEAAGGALCAVLLRHGLLRQLASMRGFYLLGSPLLEPVVAFLLRRISTATGGLDRVSEFELNAALQDALAAGGSSGSGGGKGAAGRALHATAQILPAPPQAPQGQQAIPQRVHALARLRLRVEPGWPLSLLVGEEMLAQYNQVLVLLLQLRWVKQSLQSVRYHGWKAGRRASQTPAARDGLQHQMVHLVDSVLQYMTDRVAAAGAWLEQAVAACGSLDDMHRCRAKYLRAVTRYCLLSPEGVARLVHEGLLHLLNACLQYCALRRQQEAVAAALAHLAAQQQRQQQQGSGAGPGEAQASEEEAEEEADAAAAEGPGRQRPAAPAGLQWAGRRAELAKRGGELRAALGALRRDWSNRQRLLLRVLAAKAAEAGSHADELRQVLGALDFSRHYESSMV